MPPQFYLPAESRANDEFHLDGPEAYHVAKVLRRRAGDALELFDGRGGRYRGTILRITKAGVEGRIDSVLAAPRAGPKARLHLYAALLKGRHWEWLLEKATEIGVSCVIPVMTQRTVVLLKEDERIGAKLDHWRKVMLAAAKQCDLETLPDLRPPVALRDALAEAEKAGPILFAWERMKGALSREPITEAAAQLKNSDSKPGTISLFIGPEGGFAEEEVELAEIHNASFFGLGSNVLRGETAALAASALVLYELGAL